MNPFIVETSHEAVLGSADGLYMSGTSVAGKMYDIRVFGFDDLKNRVAGMSGDDVNLMISKHRNYRTFMLVFVGYLTGKFGSASVAMDASKSVVNAFGVRF